jgi:hypothetical protein
MRINFKSTSFEVTVLHTALHLIKIYLFRKLQDHISFWIGVIPQPTPPQHKLNKNYFKGTLL